jgi:putative ABC transport system permease protein
MFAYQLRLAWKSLRRNPVLSSLMVLGIGLGIAVAMTFVASYYHMSGNPVPHKSERLFRVQLDSWDPQRAWDPDDPEEPPPQLTYRDTMSLLDNEIPTLSAAMNRLIVAVEPPGEGQRPFRIIARMCSADFFPMFEPPFRHGGGWTRAADAGPEPVVVLGPDLNQRIFGGEDSVGRKLRIQGREVEVVGVLDTWRPTPKYFDLSGGAFSEVEQLYMPFQFMREFKMHSSGNTASWGTFEDDFDWFLQSEAIWVQYWVQLDTQQQREEYSAFLEAYINEQKAIGRFQRPINYRLRDAMQWVRSRDVMPEEAPALLINALLFLLICSVNLIGILLGKFLARGPEVAVRRALGASRRWVFLQHLIECELTGLIGGLLGLALSVLGVRLVGRMFGIRIGGGMDLPLFLIALGLALLAAMIAGLYPAWKICRIEPGVQLKAQ